ncbi:MAG: hypothetical protein ACQCN5_01830 [Candidatus Bathyarchaeia archaeon]|jgi:hypothetical protein
MQATSKTPDSSTPKINLVGTKTGQCQICKQTKQILLLKYGFSLCEDCLSVCIGILEHLQNGANKKPTNKPTRKACPKTSKKPPVRKTAATKNAHASTKN